MSRKAGKRKEQPTQPTPPVEPAPEVEEKEGPILYRLSVGDMVLHTDTPAYMRFFIFRPDYDDVVAEIETRRSAGEEIDVEEEWQLTARFAELFLSLSEDFFLADLYLDRAFVQEGEVDEITERVCDWLEEIDVEGGNLSVYWMDEIAVYGFGSD